MPTFVRIVKAAPNWYRETAEPFLSQEDVPADPLADLPTTQNVLSVYVIEEDRSNLTRVVAAHASLRAKADDTGYIVFTSALLDRIGAGIDDSKPGKTADSDVNARHRDVTKLTGKKLVAFVREVLLSDEVPETLSRDELIEILRKGIEKGTVDLRRLQPTLRTQLS